MGRKFWEGSAPFWGGGAGSPSNTKSPGLSPTSIPSGILIHPAIWPQQIWAKNWRAPPPLGRLSWVPNPHLTQCGQGWVLPARQVSSWSVQPFHHNTPMSQTGKTGQDRQDNGLIAKGELFYKRLPKNWSEKVPKWYCLLIIIDNNDTDLEVSDTCIRNSLLFWLQYKNAPSTDLNPSPDTVKTKTKSCNFISHW